MQKRIPELDGLRALAVLMVLLWHYIGIPGGGALWTFFRPGRSGVDLFFVLSGFLITSILIERRGSESYFRYFYARRAFRILPVYVLMLAVLIAGRQGGWNSTLFGGNYPVWTYALFVQNFATVGARDYGAPWMSITWSLAIEEQFYLLFPLLVALADPKRLPRYLVVILVAGPILRLASYPFIGWTYYVMAPCRADSLAAGALIAWAFTDARATKWLDTQRDTIRRAALWLLALSPALWAIPDRSLWLHMALWGHTYLTVLFAVVLLAVLLHPGSPSLWLFRTKAAAGLASISYGLYMVHPAVLAALAGGGRATLADVPMAAAITLAVCVVSYFLIERPALRIGRIVSTRL